MTTDRPSDLPVTRDHRRQWRRCLYVYPVISRRSKGLSVGVNLNPDKRCNFACLYCQIDRHVRRDLREVSVEVLREELRLCLGEAGSGALWQEERFASVPAGLRRVNDIAFSGDGEPTCLPQFDRAVAAAAEVKDELGLDQVKIVVITNATGLGAPPVRRALPILDGHNGEIWAKLDAGTEAYFQLVNRPHPRVGLDAIVAGIASVARGRGVVIQSLFFRRDGQAPPAEEVDAYCGRLQAILAGGGTIKLVQVHTIARPPAEAGVSALGDGELDAIADRVRHVVPDVPVETYYGANVPPQGQGGGVRGRTEEEEEEEEA